jgi:hypothetical protein
VFLGSNQLSPGFVCNSVSHSLFAYKCKDKSHRLTEEESLFVQHKLKSACIIPSPPWLQFWLETGATTIGRLSEKRSHVILTLERLVLSPVPCYSFMFYKTLPHRHAHLVAPVSVQSDNDVDFRYCLHFLTSVFSFLGSVLNLCDPVAGCQSLPLFLSYAPISTIQALPLLPLGV